MDGVARRLQLLKHGKNLQDVAMFGSLKPAVMRQLAMKMQDVSFARPVLLIARARFSAPFRGTCKPRVWATCACRSASSLGSPFGSRDTS